MKREINYRFDIDKLEHGDVVDFCVNDFDSLPSQAKYLRREGFDLVFEGFDRTQERKLMRYGVSISDLSAKSGRMQIRARCTVRGYNK